MSGNKWCERYSGREPFLDFERTETSYLRLCKRCQDRRREPFLDFERTETLAPWRAGACPLQVANPSSTLRGLKRNAIRPLLLSPPCHRPFLDFERTETVERYAPCDSRDSCRRPFLDFERTETRTPR